MTKSVRRITAEKKDKLNTLAKILYEFIPLTSKSSKTITFRTIFKESKIDNYFDGQDNKLQALEIGFEKLYRYHEKLPRIIIRKVIPAAISYRQHKRNPLRKEELEALSSCLKELGFDMSKEISAIELSEDLPRITIPPERLKERLKQHDLDQAISSESLTLFNDGHFNEAVRKACEKLESRVRNVSGEQAIGRDLMAKVFSNDNHIDLQGVKPENRQAFQEGYKFLTMGAMSAIRNIFSHGDEEIRSPEECFEMLLFLNWLFRFIK